MRPHTRRTVVLSAIAVCGTAAIVSTDTLQYSEAGLR